MKSSLKFMLLIVSFFNTNNFCLAQESIMLKTLGEKVVQKQWEVSLPVPLEDLTFNYAILNDGVATYSRKNRTLMCFGFDGKLKWEKVTSEYPAAQLFASPNGAYLMVSYSIAENVGTTVIYNDRGEALWQPNERTGYYFSASSKYMIDCGYNPKVLNNKTGEILWKLDDQKYLGWKVISTKDDKLVVCAGSSLELFDLPTGKRLWQRDLSLFGSSIYLKVAKNGSLITIQNLVFTGINKNYIFVYNMHGDLLHKIEKPIIVGKTNGGIIQAISDDGQYFAIGDFEEFYVCSSKTFDRVWTVHEKIRPLDVQKFTQNLLAFKPSYDAKKTRVLILNNNGQIKKDYLFTQILNFDTPVSLLESEGNFRKNGSKQEQTNPAISALQIDEKQLGGVMLSLYSLNSLLMKD